VASRSAERARSFAEETSVAGKLVVEPMPSVEDAVRGADIVVLATDSAEPVIRREWIAAGTHINAVGASLPTRREVDSATLVAARLFVDRRESTVNEAGDYLIPLAEGVIGPGHIQAEIGELVTGASPGRESRDEITLFKSLGLAVEDLAAAAVVCDRAGASGVGTWVDC
jgi:ornithine cyclodeaminase